jgi:hypothetical protein
MASGLAKLARRAAVAKLAIARQSSDFRCHLSGTTKLARVQLGRSGWPRSPTQKKRAAQLSEERALPSPGEGFPGRDAGEAAMAYCESPALRAI